MKKLMLLSPRGGSRTAATSKVELFVIIVNSFQPLTVITKSSTLDIVAVLDPPLSPLCVHVIRILFFSVVEKPSSSYLQETSQSSKYGLKTSLKYLH